MCNEGKIVAAGERTFANKAIRTAPKVDGKQRFDSLPH